ncbi:MAG TPA: hypothetical protein VMR96_00270 [Solirubrobacterales bacterium]|nr:hypothetical protein [Solirubrobacterales bacterium]
MKPVLTPTAEQWWEYSNGTSTVFVVADDPAAARRKAEAHLQDLGVLPGGPPGLHESFERMREFARRGR